MSVTYGAGLRVAEVSTLKVADVDSARMLLRIERGKGGRYRNTMLSEDLLTLLREWWRGGRRQGVIHRDGWLFKESELDEAQDEDTRTETKDEIADLKAQIAALKAAKETKSTAQQATQASDDENTSRIGTRNFKDGDPFGEREMYV